MLIDVLERRARRKKDIDIALTYYMHTYTLSRDTLHKIEVRLLVSCIYPRELDELRAIIHKKTKYEIKRITARDDYVVLIIDEKEEKEVRGDE